MAKERTPEIDKLYADVLDYRRTADFKNLLEFVARFRDVAPYNAMLIHTQKPGSTYVASASDWKLRFHRKVKAGARPLQILRPFGPVAFVFEYNDTEGRPLPDKMVRPFMVNNPVEKYQLDRIIKAAGFEGIDVGFQQYGTSRGGQLEYSDYVNTLIFEHGSKRYYIESNYSIVINAASTIAEQFNTMLHELGHYFCGHLNYNNLKWIPKRTGLSKEEVEFEAETVCWLVCQRLGIESISVRYLSGYLENKEYIPDVSVDAMLKAAGKIESMLTEEIKPRKELITKEIDLSGQINMFDMFDT